MKLRKNSTRGKKIQQKIISRTECDLLQGNVQTVTLKCHCFHKNLNQSFVEECGNTLVSTPDRSLCLPATYFPFV